MWVFFSMGTVIADSAHSRPNGSAQRIPSLRGGSSAWPDLLAKKPQKILFFLKKKKRIGGGRAISLRGVRPPTDSLSGVQEGERVAGSGVGMDASGFLLWVAHSVYCGFVGRTGRAEFTGVGLLTDLLPKRFIFFW